MAACNDCKDGDRGPRGDQGLKGDTGASGAVGIDGPIGLQGIQGVDGPQGDQGAQGIAGLNGGDTTGPAGPTGPQGNIGTTGATGGVGSNGSNGANGANGQGRLNYVTDVQALVHTLNPTLNEGVFMENTDFATVELPLGAVLGDVIRIVGTVTGTGGWEISTAAGATIQFTGLGANYTGITIAATNYTDVMTFIADGNDSWVVTDRIFANGIVPLFTL